MNESPFPWKWIYTTGGLGLLPGAPGTYASVACVVVWYLAPAISAMEFAAILFFLTILGVISAEKAVRETGISDPSFVVIDEWAGQGIALMAVPHSLLGAVMALAFFRFFDILKPPPIRWLEKAPGGVGVMLDDLGAGAMAAVLLRVVLYFFPGH